MRCRNQRSANWRIFNVGIVAPVTQAVPGACATSGFAAICPSGTCECVNIQNANVTGNFRGTANLLITEDVNATTVEQPNNCQPFFGTATFNGSTGTAALNITGADCDPLAAAGPETIQGGYGIVLPASAPASAGHGTLLEQLPSWGCCT